MPQGFACLKAKTRLLAGYDFKVSSSAISWLDQCDSTNARMLEHPDLFSSMQALATSDQIEGRGRRGRAWQLAPGDGLAISVMVQPLHPQAEWVALLPLITGLVLVRVLNENCPGLDAKLKWPNDVLVNDKKLAGILVEKVPDADSYVIGAGVNTALAQAPQEAPNATSLAMCGFTLANEQLAEKFRDALAAMVFALDQAKIGTETLLADISASTVTLGQRVRVSLPDGSHLVGVAALLDPSGSLMITLSDGTSRSVVAGEVERLRPVSNEFCGRD